MNGRSRAGFTIMELLFALLVGGLLLLLLARVADTVDRVGDAARAGSDASALEWTTERVLRRALEDAGFGMPSSPNLGGIGVRAATQANGMPADTLITLRAEDDAIAVAARPCSDTVRTPCVALAGDQRGRLSAGDLVIVGARGTGFTAFQVADAPTVFRAPCGSDCPERLFCPVTAGPPQSFPRVVGSVLQPSGATSPLPCTHPVLADGSRCEEVVQVVSAGARQTPSCRVQGASVAFTNLPVVDRTGVLGFPPSPIPLTTSGAGATPRVRAVRVRAARFWVRATTAADTVLVRQNGLTAEGDWRPPVAVAGPLVGMKVETLQPGTGWTDGIGLGPRDLLPVAGNANYERNSPAPAGVPTGSTFRRGHHSVAAVRVRYIYRTRASSTGLLARRDAWIIVATPALLAGGTGDLR